MSVEDPLKSLPMGIHDPFLSAVDFAEPQTFKEPFAILFFRHSSRVLLDLTTDMVPCRLMLVLYENFKVPKVFWTLSEADDKSLNFIVQILVPTLLLYRIKVKTFSARQNLVPIC